MGADRVWVSPHSAQSERGRVRETWDNSPQLIHCVLKTHYCLRRNLEKKKCSPRRKEILRLRWRPWHNLPGFPQVWNFFYAQFSGLDSLSLLTSGFVRRSPGLQRTHSPAVKHTHTHTHLTIWWTQLLYLYTQRRAALGTHACVF